MMNEERQTALRRMKILQALSLHVGHSAMPAKLRDEMEATGHPMTLTKLMLDCAFLAELALVDAPEAGQIALTSEGLDVVRGLVKLPGLDSRPHAHGVPAAQLTDAPVVWKG